MSVCTLDSDQKWVIGRKLTLEQLEVILATLRERGEVHIKTLSTDNIPSLCEFVVEAMRKLNGISA